MMRISKLNRVPFRARTRRTGLMLACAVAFSGVSRAVVSEESGELLWSLAPVIRPAVPEGNETLTNPIDRFLKVDRVAKGVQAVAPADKLTLL
ncbi:MAG: hypothetical protein EOP88_27230, partial [Verrucomicrobiaceae bacterium]